MRVRTKICGIGSAADLAAAVSAGVDAVGFIVATTHETEDELPCSRLTIWLAPHRFS